MSKVVVITLRPTAGGPFLEGELDSRRDNAPRR